MSGTRKENCPRCGGTLEPTKAFWCDCCEFTSTEPAQVCECPVCQTFYHLEFHPDGSCPSCGAWGTRFSELVCSLCGGRVGEVDALRCPGCGRYFPRAELAVEDPSRGWTFKLGVKRAMTCEACGEEDPEWLGVRLARFTLDMSGQYWETVHAMCQDCDNSLRFGEMVTIADTRAVKLRGKWEKGDAIVKKVEGINRCVGCHELDQRKVGVYETMFFLESGAYDHPETWGSEVVICRECYGDLRAETPELFAKAKRVKTRIVAKKRR